MKYSAKIIVEGNADNILKLFEPETKVFKNKRAFYSINKKGKNAEFTIIANDSTALRSVMNSISKTLIVYEKVQNE
ncbi:MAG: hypothetical protein ABIB43_02110 [archaeon]